MLASSPLFVLAPRRPVLPYVIMRACTLPAQVQNQLDGDGMRGVRWLECSRQCHGGCSAAAWAMANVFRLFSVCTLTRTLIPSLHLHAAFVTLLTRLSMHDCTFLRFH